MTGTSHGFCASAAWPQAKKPVAVNIKYVTIIGKRNSGSVVDLVMTLMGNTGR